MTRLWFILVTFSLVASAATDPLQIIRPWGRETVENTKSFFSSYKNILLVRVEKESWHSRKPPKESSYHFRGKVAKVYKGNWEKGEPIALVHYVDGPAPKKAKDSKGELLFVLTNQHQSSEIPLETGDFLPYRKDLEAGLDWFYPPPQEARKEDRQ